MRSCWGNGAPASWSTTSEARWTGVGADAEPASAVAAEIVAAGGAAVADSSDVASEDGAQALVDSAVERFGQRRHRGQQRGHHPMGRASGSGRGEPREPHRRARRRIVQHHPRRVAPNGRTGLRAHRHDQLLGDVRAAQQPLVRHRQGRCHRDDPQPRHRRRRSRHQDQRHRTGGDDAHGGTRCRGRAGCDADGAGSGRADGRLPRPRGLPRQR